MSWTQRTILSLASALAAVALAASSAQALPPEGGYCDVTNRSCASDGGTSGGGSYEGSEPRPQWIAGQEFIVAPGAPGWDKHIATYQRCDAWFKYVALPAGYNAAGQVVVLRLSYSEKRWWFLWC